MSDLKICINASNLHCGGGVQVASSFIYELSLLHDLPENITCLVSSEVAKNLHQVGCTSNYKNKIESKKKNNADKKKLGKRIRNSNN